MCILSKDLIMEILLRLPVKSLGRFKLVSKEWNSLICDPGFVKMHLSRTQTLERTRLLADGMNNLYSVDLEMLSSDAAEDGISMVGLDFPAGRKDEPHCISCIGSCSGLLCVSNEFGHLFLFNPCTKESKKIAISDGLVDVVVLYGFGYSKSVDDYKVVKIVRPRKTVEVYSLRNGSWTSFSCDFVFPGKCLTWGVSLNGALHWGFRNPEGSCVIVAFDLAKEEFKTLPPPDDNLLTDDSGCSLGILRGRLCLATKTSNGYNQIWVMEEYGLKGSWTRLVVPKSFSELRPLCYLNDSAIVLLITEEGLVFWDVKDGILKNVEVGIFCYYPEPEPKCNILHYNLVDFREEEHWCDADVYVESLVTLDRQFNRVADDPGSSKGETQGQ